MEVADAHGSIAMLPSLASSRRMIARSASSSADERWQAAFTTPGEFCHFRRRVISLPFFRASALKMRRRGDVD